ncbi:hypothetical protein ACFSM5_06750 [Lacibacterium aquatile]|uniref:CMP/dCMP-type deaminase domain-containing protein n=1 Tax=Lacibacterium aquatile TaxID=1168082 RepID=A0ABW5DSQ2_9PROT
MTTPTRRLQGRTQNPHMAVFRLVHTLKNSEHAEVAVLVSESGKVLGWSSGSVGKNRRRVTPAFRLISNYIDEFGKPGRCYVYTSYPPTSACYGNIFKTDVECVFFNTYPVPMGTLPQDITVKRYFKGDSVTAEDVDRSDVGRYFTDDIHADMAVEDLELNFITMGHQSFGSDIRVTGPGAVQSFVQHDIYMAVTMGMLSRVTVERGFDAGNAVAAILVDEQSGLILAGGLNTNSSSSTLHGEYNCIMNHAYRDPEFSNKNKVILYTSLESCPRCAGLFTFMYPGSKAYYARTDDGFGTTALRSNLAGCSQTHLPWLNEPIDPKKRFAKPQISTVFYGKDGSQTPFAEVRDTKINGGFVRNKKLVGFEPWKPTKVAPTLNKQLQLYPDLAVVISIGTALEQIKNDDKYPLPPRFTKNTDADLKTYSYCLDYLREFFEFNQRLIKERTKAV